jgi:hypothetical protein
LLGDEEVLSALMQKWKASERFIIKRRVAESKDEEEKVGFLAILNFFLNPANLIFF